MRSKITVVGAGFVGSTLVQRIAERDYADVVMFDIVPNMPQGKALDMLQAGPVLGYDSLITGTNDYADTADLDVVVITSGFPRKPGMSRDDLLKKNQEIVTQVVEQIVKYSPDSILIIVTNPLDAMAQVALKASGFPRERVIGMAGVLDTFSFSHIYCSGVKRISARCAGLCIGRSWRYHGAYSALMHRRRSADL